MEQRHKEVHIQQSYSAEMEQRHKEVHIQQSVEQRAGVEVTLGAESSGSTEQGVAELEKSSEWIDVSPGKSSRSPAKEMELTFGQVAILTNSRFSVLSEEEGEIVEDAREEAVDMVGEGENYSKTVTTKGL
ncbi:hypothetical protein Rs2_23464 [Raphanus sativus]|nr:hypothetical protein Rs2_23464 [Raphanus sativus]